MLRHAGLDEAYGFVKKYNITLSDMENFKIELIDYEVLFLTKLHARLFSRIGIGCALIYIILFLSTGLDALATVSPWLAFLLCVLLSVGGFILAILSIVGERTHLLPYLTAFLSTLLILFTIFVFLLPEGGIPPAIPLFYNG